MKNDAVIYKVISKTYDQLINNPDIELPKNFDISDIRKTVTFFFAQVIQLLRAGQQVRIPYFFNFLISEKKQSFIEFEKGVTLEKVLKEKEDKRKLTKKDKETKELIKEVKSNKKIKIGTMQQKVNFKKPGQ